MVTALLANEARFSLNEKSHNSLHSVDESEVSNKMYTHMLKSAERQASSLDERTTLGRKASIESKTKDNLISIAEGDDIIGSPLTLPPSMLLDNVTKVRSKEFIVAKERTIVHISHEPVFSK